MKRVTTFCFITLMLLSQAACAEHSDEEIGGGLSFAGVKLVKCDDAPSKLPTRMPQPNHRVLLVSFASMHNLGGVDQGLIHDDISACPLDTARLYASDFYVYYQGMAPDTKRYLYDIWFEYRDQARTNLRFAEPNYPAYDLQKNPVNVCIAIGRNAANIVAVPREAIVEALKALPR